MTPFILIVNFIALLITAFVAGILIAVLFVPSFRKKIVTEITDLRKKHPALTLTRAPNNPLLTQRDNHWEAEAVLNPAAVLVGDRIHLIYRAIGADGVSRLGYASSEDGIAFDERLPYPVYAAKSPGGTPHAQSRYSPVLYPSGGSWGGCEDPRMVTIDGRIYVTFTIFDTETLRMGVISMSKQDFIKKSFDKWGELVILSSGTREKNWTLFPEKINGKFAVLHGIIDDDISRVRIFYTNSLETLSQEKFKTIDPQKVPNKLISWHVHTRSAGPPPIKTPYGWLILYHAHDADESHRYKLGAMLLDLNDPTKILHRSPHPIMEPDADYENNGKPGVIYVCGAVIKDGTLFVYYGGADKVVAVATTPLKEFIDALVHENDYALKEQKLSIPV